MYEGGCLCGEVRYRVSGEAFFVAYCHCRSCTLTSGAPLVAWATFAKSQFELAKGSPLEHASSLPVRRTFCSRCGSALTYTHAERADQVDVTLATIDDPAGLVPICHVWVSQKRPWLVIGDELPRYMEWPGSALA